MTTIAAQKARKYRSGTSRLPRIAHKTNSADMLLRGAQKTSTTN